MLTTALRRAQVNLQGHRRWLSAFAAHHQGSSPSSHATTAFRHDLGRVAVRQYAYITPKHIRKRAKRAQELTDHGLQSTGYSDVDLVNDIRQAVEKVDIKQVIELFRQLPKYDLLERTDTWRIAQCLHEALRRNLKASRSGKAPREDRDELVAFAELLVKQLRKGELVPDRRAHVHLLAFFKECGVRDKGILFWQWLEGQDDEFVSADVYGSAIELLAVNGAPLAEMEELYERALQRFPGNFNAYHLSPDAIVPDRDQPIDVKGISMVVLQGITTARLLQGDSRNAYLALDTALRLYPCVTPARFFKLFVEERPISEAYTVFAMACRAGILLPYDTTRKLLTLLRSSADLSSPANFLTALRQMLSAAYMSVGAGGLFTSNLLNEMVIAFSQILRLHGVSALDAKSKKQVVEAVLEVIRKAFEIFARYGAKPGLSAFNSIITNLAGFGQSKQVIGTALADMQALGLKPNNITRRSVLTAAGTVGDADLVGNAWQDLKRAKLSTGDKPDATDYHILIKAAKLSSATEFATEACKDMFLYLSETERSSVYTRLNSNVEIEREPSGDSVLDLTELLERIRTLIADLVVMDEHTKGRPATQDFSRQHLPMVLSPVPDSISTPESHLRRLYDELTADTTIASHSPKVSEAGDDAAVAKIGQTAQARRPAVSSTNFTFGMLRFENWKTMNYLLDLAEKNDAAYNKAVDEAIASMTSPPPRNKVLAFTEADSSGLSDASATSISEMKVDAAQLERATQEILRLRGRESSRPSETSASTEKAL